MKRNCPTISLQMSLPKSTRTLQEKPWKSQPFCLRTKTMLCLSRKIKNWMSWFLETKLATQHFMEPEVAKLVIITCTHPSKPFVTSYKFQELRLCFHTESLAALKQVTASLILACQEQMESYSVRKNRKSTSSKHWLMNTLQSSCPSSLTLQSYSKDCHQVKDPIEKH